MFKRALCQTILLSTLIAQPALAADSDAAAGSHAGRDIEGNALGKNVQGNPNDENVEGSRPKDIEGNSPHDIYGNKTGADKP